MNKAAVEAVRAFGWPDGFVKAVTGRKVHRAYRPGSHTAEEHFWGRGKSYAMAQRMDWSWHPVRALCGVDLPQGPRWLVPYTDGSSHDWPFPTCRDCGGPDLATALRETMGVTV